MTADKLFEELGYKGNGNYYQNRRGSHIYFDNQCKTIDVSGRGTGKCRDCKNKIITLAQLKAINEKCKELGWLDQDYELDYWDEKSREEKLNND